MESSALLKTGFACDSMVLSLSFFKRMFYSAPEAIPAFFAEETA